MKEALRALLSSLLSQAPPLATDLSSYPAPPEDAPDFRHIVAPLGRVGNQTIAKVDVSKHSAETIHHATPLTPSNGSMEDWALPQAFQISRASKP